MILVSHNLMWQVRKKLHEKEITSLYVINCWNFSDSVACLYDRRSFSESNCSSDDVKSAVCTSECLMVLTKTIYLKAH
jgi:hypothetical protein